MFVHRFRDIDPDLRVLCIEKLGEWLRALPQYWLDDRHLKYIGWTLSDKVRGINSAGDNAEGVIDSHESASPFSFVGSLPPRAFACVFVQHGGVRLASVQSILGIVSSGDSVLVEKANSFLERFSRRVQEMTSDADPEVAAAAVELLAQFLDAGRLSETEGDNVPPLMWDENAHIREGAVSFVMADTYSADSLDVQPEDDVTQLLNLFDKYCPRPEEQQQDSGHKKMQQHASKQGGREEESGGGCKR